MAEAASAVVADMDTSGGRIISNSANIAAAFDAIDAMKAQLWQDEWTDAVADYLESLDDTTDRVISYAATLGTADVAAAGLLRRQYKSLVADMLTNPSTLAAGLFIPAYQSISASVASGGTAAATIAAAKDLITGTDEREGGIQRAVAQPVSDVQAVHERATTQAATGKIEKEFYLYQGSEIDTTRPFCAERRNKVWHKREIEDWARLDWAGKMPETNRSNIFDLLGGYNCRHILLPLARRDVPQADWQRMKSKGLV